MADKNDNNKKLQTIAGGTEAWYKDFVDQASDPVPCGDEGVLAIVRDITERKQLEERILHMSLHDPCEKAMAPEAIRAEFERCSGSQFDPRLTEIFLVIVANDG